MKIPVNILWKFGKPKGERFFVGPYFAFNLGGTLKDNSSYGGSTSAKLNIGAGVGDDIKGFDFGVGLNLGYQLTNGLFIRGHYQYGLVNLLPQGDANNTMRNYNFGVTVGFLINTKKPKKEEPKK